MTTIFIFVKMETIAEMIKMMIFLLLTSLFEGDIMILLLIIRFFSFISLLEGASKPIDNEEEESYKAAFAGDTNITMFKLIIAQLLSFILIFPFLTQLLTGITMARSLWDLSR